ncbi:MAG: HAMP domain-containing protein [Bacteroidetes bacterium]|nr:MAG: HAMP domain-containing protein [Bacteroidota bacterium]
MRNAFFKNFKISHKIAFGYGFTILMVVVAGITSVSTVLRLVNLDHKISESYLPSVETLKVLENTIITSSKYTENWIYLPSVEDKAKLKAIQEKDYFNIKLKFNEQLDLWENANEIKNGLDLLNNIDILVENQLRIMNLLIIDDDYVNDKKVEEAIKILETQVIVYRKKTTAEIDYLLRLKNKQLQKAKLEKESMASFLIYMMVMISIFTVLVGIYASILTTKSIVLPIKLLKENILELSKGNTTISPILANDEIGEMANALFILTNNLKNVRDFAKEVGKGNFETTISVFNNEGELGTSLAEMRKGLQNVAFEDKKRNWVNQNLAKASEILRNVNISSNELYFNILKFIIKALDANQGGFYIAKDNEETGKTTLHLEACFAYERKKYVDHSIEVNKKSYESDGLIGQVFLEKDTYILTDIPENYLKITSGLGESTPKFVVIVPIKIHDDIYGILEIASFNHIPQYQIEYLEKISESIASTISNMHTTERTAILLSQSQLQAEQMRATEEELRQNLEELHATQEQIIRQSKNNSPRKKM